MKRTKCEKNGKKKAACLHKTIQYNMVKSTYRAQLIQIKLAILAISLKITCEG